jgi:hypothetical protein
MAPNYHQESDEEKAHPADFVKPDPLDEPELTPALARVAHKGFFGTLRHFEEVLDRKLGVEAHGPARILPEERDPKYGKWSHQVVMALMWASGTMNLSCFATGFLGWELGLDLGTTIYITIIASFAGSAVTGWVRFHRPLHMTFTNQKNHSVPQWDLQQGFDRSLSVDTPSAGGRVRSSLF